MNMKIGVLAIVAGFAGAVLFSQSQRPTGMPDLGGAVGWLNSGALNSKSLRGKVVLVNFWTYTCINSRNRYHRRKNNAHGAPPRTGRSPRSRNASARFAEDFVNSSRRFSRRGPAPAFAANPFGPRLGPWAPARRFPTTPVARASKSSLVRQ